MGLAFSTGRAYNETTLNSKEVFYESTLFPVSAADQAGSEAARRPAAAGLRLRERSGNGLRRSDGLHLPPGPLRRLRNDVH